MSKHSASGPEWQAQRLRVLARDGWQCAYCGKPLEGSDATVDHINPIAQSEKREYSDSELISACRKCNSLKSDRVMVRTYYRSPRWFGAA